MNKKFLTLAVLGALGAAQQSYGAVGVFFDPTGTSQPGIPVTTFSWLVDNSLLVGGGGADGAVTLKAVAQLNNAGGLGPTYSNPGVHTFTYEFSIPLTATHAAGSIQLTPRAGASFFDVFAEIPASPNQAAGTGYGANSGAASTTTILHGTMSLLTSSATMSVSTNADGSYNFLKNGDLLGETIASKIMSFTQTFNIDVLTQDSAYFRSDINSFALDLRLISQGFNAPFTPAPNDPFVAAKVQGITPDFGVNGTVSLDTDNDGIGDASFTGKLNDDTCNRLGQCDIQLSTGAGTLQVQKHDISLPEPGSLALLGLGLGVLGGLRRRRT